MSLIKLGEAITVTAADLQAPESVLADADILNRFQKIASELKTIAPKAKDFLYFSCIVMNSAEASILNPDGTIKKDAKGKELTASWDKKGESWRWVCSDPNVKPYKNSNGDIFPEEELIKAHKKWVGRPLCLDHKSSSVDFIRGVIVDTYYDRPHKRIIALCALDKINYPDLARKVATGYATSVSMGTAVGKAICYDCGNVARVESEFCDHMRCKSCYGEVNVDLNPIELSIVVNGADPQAKIRHIVAAKDSIAQYIDMKEKELADLASEQGDADQADKIADGLAEIEKKVVELKEQIKELGQHEKDEVAEMEKDDSANLKEEVSKLAESVERMSGQLNKIVNKFASNEDIKMTTKNAYFQGGGGVNEPTPGKPKYEKEDEDKIRATEDKQMGGQMDTGPVDGMHPGYDSFGESEEARKKRLLRAEEKEQRALRRQAALEKAKENLANRKEAYFQGGGGANEPTPGKAKYPKEDADGIRDDEDKQMTGQAPFPGVGAVDGLHPSPASADVKDELKRKQMLARAALSAKFIKAANPVTGEDDLGESRWQIFADKKLVLTATVKEISGGNVAAMYDTIATKEYGSKMMNTIRAEGMSKAVSLYKGAQAAPEVPAMPEMPAAPVAPVAAEAPKDEAVDAGGTGDPKEELDTAVTDAENSVAKIREGINALVGNTDKVGDELGGIDDAALSPATAELVTMQKKLGSALLLGMKEAEAELNSSISELQLSKQILANKSNLKKADLAYVHELVRSACRDSNQTVSDAKQLMEAFTYYAGGTDKLIRNAAKEVELYKTAQAVHMPEEKITAPKPAAPAAKPAPASAPAKPAAPAGNAYKQPEHKDVMKGLMPDLVKDMNKPAPAPAPAPSNTHKLEQGGSPNAPTVKVLTPEEIAKGNSKTQWMPKPDAHKDDDMAYVDDDKKDENDLKMNSDGSCEGTSKEIGEMKAEEKKASENFDKTTKEGRAAWRAKLAEKGMVFSDVLNKAHPKGGVTTELDTKPAGDLAKVETLQEQNKAFMDVATAPPKVRKQAEDIHKLVVAGKLNPTDEMFDKLIAQGLDSNAVKYYKAFWAESKDGGSQYASELIKEHQKAKVAEEQETYRVKIARAYELAYDMVRKGMIGEDRHAVSAQVNEFMNLGDAGFESMKRFVDRQPMTKQASIPQVGIMGANEVTIPAPEAAPSELRVELEAAFAQTSWKRR